MMMLILGEQLVDMYDNTRIDEKSLYQSHLIRSTYTLRTRQFGLRGMEVVREVLSLLVDK